MDRYPNKQHNRLSAILGVAGGAVAISFSSIFVALADVGPATAGFYRMLFGALTLLLILPLLRQPLRIQPRTLLLSAIAGLLFTGDLSVWHRSIHGVGPGLATILGNFQVFVMVAVGALFLHERVTSRTLLAVIMAFTGLLLLVGPGWTQWPSDWRSGVLYGLATALFYAAFIITLRCMQQTSEDNAQQIWNMALVALWTSLFLAIGIPLTGESFSIPDTTSLWSLIAYGVLCQALGWYMISRNLPRVDLSIAGIVILLQPALSFVWDILLFGRPTSALDLLGAAITLAAIYIAVTRQQKTA